MKSDREQVENWLASDRGNVTVTIITILLVVGVAVNLVADLSAPWNWVAGAVMVAGAAGGGWMWWNKTGAR